jgi:taurine dioxygenase
MLEIRPLSDALGAEVSGLDLSQPLDDETISAIKKAFLDHHLLCIRSKPLEPADFARLAGYFGQPQLQLLRKRRHGETPEVSILESTYKRPEDKPDDMRLVRLSGWHTDDSYFAVPAKATMLQSIKIPDSGGETKFCNMRKAYVDLPEDKKRQFGALRAVHGYDTKRAPARAIKLTKEEEDETPAVDHPLVRTHEDTGEKTIYFNSNRTDHIVGMARAESDALLDHVYQHVTQPKYQYHHKWRVGDILLWDNRCLMHAVNMDFPVGQTRLHQRILLQGARPV